MQTFLPYPDFAASAKVLDYRRLGKQRLECKIILTTLFHGGGWARHPAVQMWKGRERALCHYGLAMSAEWRLRGYTDSTSAFFRNILGEGIDAPYDLPWWVGDDRFHVAHRSNLLRKLPNHYRQFWPDLTPGIHYRWPLPDKPGKYKRLFSGDRF